MLLESYVFFIDKDGVGRGGLAETTKSSPPSNNNSINHSPGIVSNSSEDVNLPETNSTTRFNNLFHFCDY